MQVVQQGQELAAAIAEASDVMASSGSDSSEAAPLDAQARVQLLLEFLHDRQLDLEELAEERRARFEQCVQLGSSLFNSLLSALFEHGLKLPLYFIIFTYGCWLVVDHFYR